MARKSRKKPNAAVVIESPNEQVLPLKEEVVQTPKAGLATAAYIRLSVENNGHETDDSLKTQIALVEQFVQG